MTRTYDVAIVGGYGEVGIHATRRLSEQGHRVLVGGRSPEKGRAVLAEAGIKADVAQLDIFDDASLNAFCSQARVVLNTAGPSSSIEDRIAVFSLQNGSHFFDCGIMEVLNEKVEARSDEWKNKDLACIYATGLHPGLDDLFGGYADAKAAEHLDRFTSLEVFFGDKSPWNGKGSLRDIVWGLYQGALSYYYGFLKDGAYTKAGMFNGFKKVQFEEVGNLRWALMYQPLLAHLGQRYPFVASWSWYDFSIIGAAVWTKFRYKLGDEAGVDYMYKKIVERNRQYDHLDTDTFVYVIVKGEKGGQKKELEYRIVLPRERGYWAVGIVPAVAVDWFLKGRITHRGAGALGNIVDPVAFLEDMQSVGLNIQFRER